ncbi:MAG: hypothetical protein JO202_17455 [Ktedonobacteraceae bacterium]|nr:hypothetical protein [Ktedonobacteraceae bacterium]
MKRGFVTPMKRGSPPPGYYTPSEAKKKLHVDDSTLRSYVLRGKVEKFTPPEKKQGFYKKTDVDKLAEELRAAYGKLSKEMHFQRTTEREDIAECSRIAREVYGSEGTSVETRLAWMSKNPELLYTIKSDYIAGYGYILPLKREKIDAILREELSLSDLTADDIESFVPDKPVDIYLMSVAIKPGYNKEEKRLLSSQLISGLMSILLDLAHRRVVIRTLIGRSRLPDGIRLMRDMGFDNYPIQSPDKRFSYFIIEVDKSNAPLTRRYKRALDGTLEGQNNGDD